MRNVKGIYDEKKVLLAEDSNVFRQFHKSLFEMLDFKVDLAKNGNEILRKIHDCQYCLILMDMELPDMDCIQVTKKIFRVNIVGQLKVVVLAEMQCISRYLMRQFLSVDISAVIMKPLSVPGILQLLKL